MNLNWEENPNANALPLAAASDIVHLKLVNTFEYLVKGIVSGIEAGKVEATVEAIFDWHGQGQVSATDTNELIGKSLSFLPKYIHKVIKR